MAGSAWSNQVQNQVIIAGSQGQLLVYSPAPGANKLIYSISSRQFTDPYGNLVLQGATEYQNSIVNSTGWIAISMNGAATSGDAMTFYSAASEAGPWTRTAALEYLIPRTGGATTPVLLATTDTPHLATLAGSWANITGTELEYRLMPDDTVTLTGALTVPTGVTGPANTITTVPATPINYRPDRQQSVYLVETLAASPFTGTVHAGLVRTSGNLDIFGAATSGNTLHVQIRYPLGS